MKHSSMDCHARCVVHSFFGNDEGSKPPLSMLGNTTIMWHFRLTASHTSSCKHGERTSMLRSNSPNLLTSGSLKGSPSFTVLEV
jgi:hypothetical protein